MAKTAETKDIPDADTAAALPDVDALVEHDCPAETVDWETARTQAGEVRQDQLQRIAGELDDGRRALDKASQTEGRSRRELAGGLAGLYETAQQLTRMPEIIVALCQTQGVRLTRATLKSPCLPVVKLALSDLEPKTQSLYARVLNHGMAAGLDRDAFEQAVLGAGMVELARREARRQKLRKGEPAGESHEETIARFRRERRPRPLDTITLAAETQVALLMVGLDDSGAVVAFDLDDDDRRLLAAVRRANKRGQLLGARDAGAAPEDAAGEDAAGEDVAVAAE